MNEAFKNPDQDPRGLWVSNPLSIPLLGSHGSSSHRNGSSAFIFKIKCPNGEEILPKDGSCWRYSEDRIKDLIRDKRIVFTDTNKPRYKTFLSGVRSGKVPTTFWTSVDFGTNADAKREITSIFGSKNVFQTPKPGRLLERILRMGSQEGDIVLDCFAESGTTLSVAHKMKRKYIGIEIGEHCETLCIERLKKVIDGEQGGVSKQHKWKGGWRCKVFCLRRRKIMYIVNVCF